MPATEASVTRRFTWDEALAALKHVRYDFTGEPAKAILYDLTEHFHNSVGAIGYRVSYDAGEGMFFLSFSGVAAQSLLLHEGNLANNGTCHCLGMI